ncbi:hypothetical protein GCM10007414_17530 [Agarivorans gilvus]|uniref:Uncharacterized protein n=1 Tax=Agarivorans gilvus TaxID=680279 RepID=A0ABQ1I118_9ALTE|nr:hypothetical protein GCM10007414_17530 [Agarivorans gilvus]
MIIFFMYLSLNNVLTTFPCCLQEHITAGFGVAGGVSKIIELICLNFVICDALKFWLGKFTVKALG